MATLDGFTDAQLKAYQADLAKVMKRLESRLTDIAAGANEAGVFDATAILNAKPAFQEALADSGFTELAESFAGQYSTVQDVVGDEYELLGLPNPKFTTADAETFQNIALADLEQFDIIGEKALDDLRLGLYNRAVANMPMSDFVEQIRAATVGAAGNGSPLSNYTYTHANTAILRFQGEVMRATGQNLFDDLGLPEDERYWQVVGTLIATSRDACIDAVGRPVRTEEEWKAAGYFGGAPGGWNCRHRMYPFIGDAADVKAANNEGELEEPLPPDDEAKEELRDGLNA